MALKIIVYLMIFTSLAFLSAMAELHAMDNHIQVIENQFFGNNQIIVEQKENQINKMISTPLKLPTAKADMHAMDNQIQVNDNEFHGNNLIQVIQQENKIMGNLRDDEQNTTQIDGYTKETDLPTSKPVTTLVDTTQEITIPNITTSNIAMTKSQTILITSSQGDTVPNSAPADTTIVDSQTTLVPSTQGVTTPNPATTTITTTIKKLQTTVISTTPNPPTTTTTTIAPEALVEIDWSLAKFGQTSIFGGVYGADKAFLTANDKPFHSNQPVVPQALWAGFAVPVAVVKFSFQSRTDRHDEYRVFDGPTKYVFFGSNSADCSDESYWEPLFEDNSGTSFTEANIPKTELVPGNKRFTCYGFNVKDVHGRGGANKVVTMDNIKLYTTGLQELDLNNVGIKATSFYKSGSYNDPPENALHISAPGSSHHWQSAQGKLPQNPQSIWYQFPIPVVVAKYSFQSRFDNHVVDCGPSSYVFFGSNDSDCSIQSSWVTLVQDLSDKPFTAENIPKAGEIPNPQPYMCYGFKVLKIPSNYGSSLTNIRFFTPRN